MLPELCEQNSEYSDAGNLTYLEYGSKGYFLFNGNLSKAFPAAVARTRTDDRSDKRPSNTVAGKYTGNDFFAIQKTGNKKYLLIVNNKIYKELNGMDRIMPDYFFRRQTSDFLRHQRPFVLPIQNELMKKQY